METLDQHAEALLLPPEGEENKHSGELLYEINTALKTKTYYSNMNRCGLNYTAGQDSQAHQIQDFILYSRNNNNSL